MQIEYYNRARACIKVENEQQARDLLMGEFPNAFFGDWEENYEGDRRWISVWENEETSIDDSGDGAVAWIKEVV